MRISCRPERRQKFTKLRILSPEFSLSPEFRILGLRQILKRSSHADLVNRITLRFSIQPLTKDQTCAYIDSRITMAGGTAKIFDPETKDLIHDYTGGVPRQINNVATACLINAASLHQKKITEALVNETMMEFHLP